MKPASKSPHGRPVGRARRALVVALFLVLGVVLWRGLFVPLHEVVDDSLWPVAERADGPDLAAIHYEASCSAESSGRQCLLSDEQVAAMAAKAEALNRRSTESTHTMDGSDVTASHGRPGGTAHAVVDGAAGLLIAALVIYMAVRYVSRRSSRRILGHRARWALAGVVVLVVTGVTPAAAPSSSQTVPDVTAATLTSTVDVPPPFSVPLTIPPVLTGSDIDIDMAETDLQVLPDGPPTRMWTYDGIFPGPTIRRPSGQTTRVTFHNKLPVAAGDTTIHHHGSHSRSTEDGQPDSQLIPPGGSRTYTYEHVEDGGPERAVTQWYHDHRMDVTGRNVWNGLAGMFILDDEVDSALPLPKGEFDVPLVITDRTFDANNQIPYTFNLLEGTLGDTLLVNGQPQPFFEVGDRKYRVRVLNASNSRPYAMALSNGQPLIQIGTDSGLMPAPVSRDFIVIQPAERVEFVVDFAGLLGQDVVLQNLAGAGTTADIMQFRVRQDVDDDSQVPATLRPVPDFGEPDVVRNFTLELTNNDTFTINGQPFDSGRIDAAPRLGDTERWVFTNNSDQTHAIHIHDVDWRLESRNGGPPPAYEDALKETWEIGPGQTFSVITRFTDHTGRYVFHCHILEHEDLAMMAQFEVQPGLDEDIEERGG